MAYEKLQATLSKKQYLVPFDLGHQKYINVDFGKEQEMGAIIFYLKVISTFNFSFYNNIQSIILLACLLTSLETRY